MEAGGASGSKPTQAEADAQHAEDAEDAEDADDADDAEIPGQLGSVSGSFAAKDAPRR